MLKIKEQISRWAEEALAQACACQKPDSALVKEKKALAAKALENFLLLPDRLFSPENGKGMFGEKVSLWQEMGKADFALRKRLSSCPGAVRSFRCDIDTLDVYRIMVVNGGLSGGRGINHLDAAKPAKLGDEPCVCRVSDLEPTPENYAKLKGFFALAAEDVEEGSQGRCRTFAEKSPLPEKSSENDFRFYRWLNRALSDETVLVYIPANYKLDKPLQIVHLLDSPQASFVQGQCWVLLEENASMTLVQCTDSTPQTQTLANILSEIRLDRGAALEYIRLQNVGDECKLFHNLNILQDEDSRIRAYNINLNGGMTLSNTQVNLNRPHARAELFGLYLEDRKQLISHRVKVNHWARETYSRELFKGVVDDSAAAYFRGHVFVHPDAQQTEAYQTCRNLLVSPKAQAYAKPYLEIYADDVQCNHGVTVGQLDEEALFYMRSRGIPAETARRLLMRAYADEILGSISVDSLRDWLVFLVKKRFSGELQACENCTLACGSSLCPPLEHS